MNTITTKYYKHLKFFKDLYFFIFLKNFLLKSKSFISTNQNKSIQQNLF